MGKRGATGGAETKTGKFFSLNSSPRKHPNQVERMGHKE
jgi:hypothetical protein